MGRSGKKTYAAAVAGWSVASPRIMGRDGIDDVVNEYDPLATEGCDDLRSYARDIDKKEEVAAKPTGPAPADEVRRAQSAPWSKDGLLTGERKYGELCAPRAKKPAEVRVIAPTRECVVPEPVKPVAPSSGYCSLM